MKLAEVAGVGAMKLYVMVAEQLHDALKQLEKDWVGAVDVSLMDRLSSIYKLPTITVYIETPRCQQASEEMADIVESHIPSAGIQPCKATVHAMMNTKKSKLYHITVGPP